MSTGERPLSSAAKTLAILLALLAPARMAWIVFTFGENNLSNDYIARVPLVASMLDGTCSFSEFVRGAWVGGGHSTIALTPVYWASARLFAWDARVELAVGLLIAGATLALIVATLSGRARWTLLPLLSLLLFSTTKVSSFTFGESTLQMGLAQLGVALGAFCFARGSNRPIALAACAAAGGVLASWSWGGGIMVWPVFSAAFVVRRERRFGVWTLLGFGAAAGLAQYAWLLRSGDTGAASAPFSWLSKAKLVLDLIGRPLANGIGHADPSLRSQLTGAGGLLMLAALAFLCRNRVRDLSAPAVLVVWTCLVAVQIALVRFAVAPWYASPMALFWVGLVLLLAAAPQPMRVGGTVAVAALALSVQVSWDDKSFYLPSRAPASAACLREWRTAPAECHDRVFQWGPAGGAGELARLGAPLEQRGLSVFGPRRTYLLQGDFALGRVTLATPDRRTFLSGDGRTPAEADDFHRLDLVLAPGAAVTWRIDLPAQMTSARFETRVRVRADDPLLARSARATVEGSASVAHALVARGSAEPLVLDLRQFAGRTVTLRIEAENAPGDAPLVLDAPRVELHGAR